MRASNPARMLLLVLLAASNHALGYVRLTRDLRPGEVLLMHACVIVVQCAAILAVLHCLPRQQRAAAVERGKAQAKLLAGHACGAGAVPQVAGMPERSAKQQVLHGGRLQPPAAELATARAAPHTMLQPPPTPPAPGDATTVSETTAAQHNPLQQRVTTALAATATRTSWNLHNARVINPAAATRPHNKSTTTSRSTRKL